MPEPGTSTLADLSLWAFGQANDRAPDVVIGPNDNPYMLRWFVIPRNPFCNVYLHKIMRSDDDRALHDHPWDNTSLILRGRYLEHTPEGVFWREEGFMGGRKATDQHRLELMPGEHVTSLFFTGPKIREWGFWCGERFVHWTEFTSGDYNTIGAGCGEN